MFWKCYLLHLIAVVTQALVLPPGSNVSYGWLSEVNLNINLI